MVRRLPMDMVEGLAAALEGKMPSDADLDAIAALATTAFGRGFLTLADAAAARLKIGAIGGTTLLPGTDLNTRLETGLTGFQASEDNRPFTYGALLTTLRGGSEVTQLAMGVNGHLAYRASPNGTFNSWRKLYKEDNILGTVSQASGVPTGAVIEKGANGNGRYTKFADGTMICWPDNGGYQGNLYQQSPQWTTGATVTLPASFLNGDYTTVVSAHAADGSGYSGLVSTFETKSASSFRIRRPVGATDTGTTLLLSYIAIGRWF